LGDIQSDSRQLSDGDIFIALAGSRVHGVTFAANAKAMGAWVMSDCEGEDVDLFVPDLTLRLGDFLNWYYDHPSDHLALIGITGTNGKTSTSHYVAQWLCALGRRVAVMGTVGNGIWGELSTSTHTTPDAPSIYRQLAKWRDEGVQVVVMEVSSHAIDQQRIIGLNFAVLALTQVTRDHLDYHGSVEAYIAVKKRLFTNWRSKTQVLNVDDALGTELSSICAQPLAYSQRQLADIHCVDILPLADGMQVKIDVAHQSWQGCLPLYGAFNIENVLCALGCVLALGYRFDDVSPLLMATKAVTGRMQRVSQKPIVVIDYAHTPDALAKALQALRVHGGKARLCVVFGAGGNRDTGKRPLMGAVAALGADDIIITDDNPRDEQPEEIAKQIMCGMHNHDVVRYIPNRQEAICTAMREATADDVVLIAGKGHEDYQEIAAGVRLHFSDSEAVEECRV
jgi:UDP-N-acetylmuramoyl-L-alanyl-D-glutamate--2,6-diaminopimelate ligase